MIAFLRKLPIKTQVSIIAISNIIVMLFIIIFSYFKVADIFRQKNDQYTKQLVTQIEETVTYNCDIINNIVTSIAYNKVVQNYLIETNPTKKFELYKEMSNFLGNMINVKEGIVDIVLLGEDGNTFDWNGGAQISNEIINNIPERAKAYYFGIRKFESSNSKINCFLVGTKIYSINTENNSNMKIGTLLIFVDTSAIIGKTNSTDSEINDDIFLLDRNNNVFSVNGEIENEKRLSIINSLNNNNSTFVSKFFGNESIVYTKYLRAIDGKIVSIIPKNDLLYDIAELRNIQLIIFLVGILILFIPFSIVVNNILRPLKKLMTFMNNIKSGSLRNLNLRINLHGYSEMSVVAHEFNSMLDEIKSLTDNLVKTNSRLYELELEKKQSELVYLRSQINPHFLYNTLESIKGIAAEEGVPRIIEISKALAQVFRYSIKGTDFVLLKDELNIVKSYVNIQQVRFLDRFDVIYEFEDEALNCKIPKMILQPLVENAISHGLEMKMERGNLCIGSKVHNDNELIIWVKDDGVGMEEDVLDKIRSKLFNREIKSRSEAANNHGIGIVNVNNRIKLTYGEKYGISINSSLGIGTEVFIKLPIEGDTNV